MNWKKFGKELANHFQTGVSYMIPLVTAAGLLTSIAVIFGGQNVWNQTSNIWGNLRLLGQTGLGFIPVIIAAYISFSIADRPGLAPAFIVGLVASSMGTGFLGGMLVGLLVGYLVRWLKKIPMPANLTAVKSLIVIPFLATLVVGLFLIYVVGDPIKAMTVALTAWLKGMSGANAVLLAALLGGMMAVDMGGPVNKIAYAFGMAAFTSGGYQASTAMLMAIGIPPLGMFVATLIGGKKLYSDAEIESGRSALVMGIVGITEGTIPFAVADPVRVIPSIIVGTAAGCATNALFGTYQKTALSTVMAIPFSSNIILYTIAILVGVIVTALLVNFLKRFTRHNSEVKEG
ncbi:PTS fructose transporter subunit IIC [Pediococcus cellicola]|uniref:Fructose-like permease IIC component n=1 Tax=Pediococcus cellicola TaxID=319652 RepID=A0A0R2IKM2_9LACO|nr:PTS fructose transporter subunit IIC [Pediococcus cellicola]KRN65537.1 fructose-like permease IIC component [Pediococcus cellicola]GEL15577.1 PTS system fructose-family transporter subunit IIC [Pediococcus cellicola]